MKKYEDKSNIVADVIKKAREKMCLSKAEVSRRLQFYAVFLDSTEIKRIEDCKMVVKDFELIALCEVLNINYNQLKELLIHD